MADWFETMDDSLWLQSDDTGEDEARFLAHALHLSEGQAVLDAPCGAGRVAVHLAQAGYIVTCYDLRKKFIDRARARFREAGVSGKFGIGDLRDMQFSRSFDAAVNWGGSFGYFDDPGNLLVAKRYAEALLPGGRLIISQPNREGLLRSFAAVIESGPVISRQRWDKHTERIISERTVDGIQVPENTSSMRLYTPKQMRDLLQAAGLVIETSYGSIEGELWKRSSRRMTMVACKPGGV